MSAIGNLATLSQRKMSSLPFSSISILASRLRLRFRIRPEKPVARIAALTINATATLIILAHPHNE